MANRRLNAVITIGGAVTAGLRSAMGSTVSSLRQVGGAIREVQRQQRDVAATIEANRRTGQSVTDLERRYERLGDSVKRLRAAQQRLSANHNATEANQQKRAELRGQLVETAAMGAVAGSPIAAAAAFEKAMLGVSKQVEGARDKSGALTQVYYDMARQVHELGREIPIATNDIAEMVAAGARMGVAKDELIDFTKTAAMMASAFELPAGELADQMGKIAGLYKIPIPVIGDLADTINYLDDNAIAKGGDIISYLTAVGGVAGAVKITGQQVAALGSTLLTLGEGADTAGTATNAMLQKFAAADKGTKAFKSALKEVGLSASAVQKGMQVDAEGTLLKVLDAVAKLPKDKQLGVMVDLVGLEHSDTLAKLANNTAEYRKQIKMAASAEARGSMSREFEASRRTTIAQWEMAKNRVTELAVVTGSALLPAVNDLMGGIGKTVTKVADWARANQAATKAILGATVAVAGMVTVGRAAAYVMTFYRGAVLAVTSAHARLTAVIAMYRTGTLAATMSTNVFGRAILRLIPPILSVGAAIMATPIGWLIAGAALIVGAGIWIYKYWEPLKAFFAGFGQGFMSAMAPVGAAIVAAFEPIWNVVKPLALPLLEKVGGIIFDLLDWFGDLLKPISAASDTTKAFGTAGVTCGEVIGKAFTVMLKPIMLVVDAIGWINNNIGGVIEKASQIGSAISGGWQKAKDFVSGGPAAPTIPPMRGSTNGAAAAPVQQTNTYHITQLPGESAEQLARRVAEINKRQQGVQQRGAMTDGRQ